MSPSIVRYTRQIRLREVGEAGQARLAAAEVALTTDGFARTIEEKYLRAAGLSTSAAAPAEASDGVGSALTALAFEHPEARDVAEGALAALATLRRILEIA